MMMAAALRRAAFPGSLRSSKLVPAKSHCVVPLTGTPQGHIAGRWICRGASNENDEAVYFQEEGMGHICRSLDVVDSRLC